MHFQIAQESSTQRVVVRYENIEMASSYPLFAGYPSFLFIEGKQVLPVLRFQFLQWKASSHSYALLDRVALGIYETLLH